MHIHYIDHNPLTTISLRMSALVVVSGGYGDVFGL